MLGSEWSTYELEDIVWDEFGESDDNIVSRPGSEQENVCGDHVDYTKKPLLELENPAEGGTDDTVSVNVNDFVAENGGTLYSGTKEEAPTPSIEASDWPENVLNDPYSTENADKVELLAEGRHKLSVNEDGALIDEFSDGDTILRNRDSMNYSDLCGFSLTDISPTETDLELFGSELEDKESSNFLGYGWPHIGNFDDVDKMFRNCDATFGQQSGDSADDQAWASSSSLRTDVTDTKLVFRSSDLDGFTLKNEKENNDDLEKPTYPSCGENSNRDSEVEKATKKEKDDGQRTLFKSQSQFEGRRNEASLERAGAASHANGRTGVNPTASTPTLISQAYGSSVKAQEMQPWRSDSFRYMDTDMSYMQLGYNYNSDQVAMVQGLPFVKPEVQSHVSLPYNVPGDALHHRKALHRSRDPSQKPPGMTPEEKIEKLRRRQKMRAALTMMQQQQSGFSCQTKLPDQAPVQGKPEAIYNEVRDHTKAEMQSLETSALEIDSATQESSCMSSMLTEDSSLEEACLCQLQDVITQLNNETKLCIRDSLYRLARSAMQRHDVGDANSCIQSNGDKNENLSMDGPATREKLQSDRCEGLINMETVTNPIDRAVAHLLFHKPPDVSAKPLNGVLPLESRITASLQKTWMSHVFAQCSGQPNHLLPSIHNDLNKQGHHLPCQSVSPKEQARSVS